MTILDKTDHSQAASALDDIFERAVSYSESMRDDYDLSAYGASCDLARRQISTAAGWFSNVADLWFAIHRYWPDADYHDEAEEHSAAGFADLSAANDSIALCAAGQ